MTARVVVSRKLTGNPAAGVEVRVGKRPDGSRGATVESTSYNRNALSLVDPAVVRALIADLGEALEWLEAPS